MSGAIYPAGIVSNSGETLALSTSLASLGIPGIETKQVVLYNPSVDFRLHINPATRGVWFYDASASAGARYKDISRAMSDRTSVGSGTTMDAATTSDRLYIGFSDVVAGFRIVMTASVNTEGNTMTCNYWNGAWTSASPTDGTDTGASLAQSGSVTFTKPTDWLASKLGGPAPDNMTITDADAPGTRAFWLQVYWDVALTADVEIQDIWALNQDTSRGYYRAGQEYFISFDRRNTGAIEAVLAAGTDTLQVTWVKTIV